MNYNGFYISHGLDYVLKIQDGSDQPYDLHRKNACFVLESASEATVLAALAGGLGRLVGR